MGLQAITIVEEEIKRLKDNHRGFVIEEGDLDTLEARIRDRIMSELVEIPEPPIPPSDGIDIPF